MSSVLSLEKCVFNDKIKMKINPITICTLSLAMMCQLGKHKRNPDVCLHVPFSMRGSGPGGLKMGSGLHRGHAQSRGKCWMEKGPCPPKPVSGVKLEGRFLCSSIVYLVGPVQWEQSRLLSAGPF